MALAGVLSSHTGRSVETNNDSRFGQASIAFAVSETPGESFPSQPLPWTLQRGGCERPGYLPPPLAINLRRIAERFCPILDDPVEK